MDPHDQAPDGPEDELQRARDQKVLAEQLGEIRQNMKRISAFSRMQARILMWTGALSEDDVQRMLRAQILTLEDNPRPPCECADDDRFPDTTLRHGKPRTDCGRRYIGPLDPLPVARNDLYCPLEARARRGDALVPCHEAQQLLPRNTPPLPPPQTLVEKTRAMAMERINDLRNPITPCAVLHTIAMQALYNLEELTSVPVPVPPPPPAQTEGVGDLQVRRLLKQRQGMLQRTQQANHLQEEAWREQLLWLVRSGRFQSMELQDMLIQVVSVTDEGWLPCRDDDQRYLWFTRQEECTAYHDHHQGTVDGEELDDNDRQEVKDAIWDTPEVHKRCPLEIRGLDGDRTVPCVEALRMARDPAVQASADLHYHQHEEQEDEEDQEDQEDQEDDDEDGAGGEDGEDGEGDADGPDPADPVVALEMRPCHLLGRFLARNLYPILKAHADHPGEDDHLFEGSSAKDRAEAQDQDDEEDEDDDEDDDDQD